MTDREKLELLCKALHQAEAEGVTLPKCIDHAWFLITFYQHENIDEAQGQQGS